MLSTDHRLGGTRGKERQCDRKQSGLLNAGGHMEGTYAPLHSPGITASACVLPSILFWHLYTPLVLFSVV